MASNKRKTYYFLKRSQSFKYAFNGIIFGIKTQANLRIHLVAIILVTALGFYFHLSYAEWVLIILAMGSVLSAELFNSAIEVLTDLISPQKNTFAGKIKDMAAGAVLISAITAAIIGLLIFLPKVKTLF
jgi:diacylglycerol kinase